MPTSTQSIREIVATRPFASRRFERFDIDLCPQAENSLDCACAELQLLADQVQGMTSCFRAPSGWKLN